MPFNLNNLVFLLLLLPAFIFLNKRIQNDKKEIFIIVSSLIVLFLINPYTLSFIIFLIGLNVLLSQSIKNECWFKWTWIIGHLILFTILNYTKFTEELLSHLNESFLHQNTEPTIFAKSIIITSSAIFLKKRCSINIKSISDFLFFPKTLTIPNLKNEKQFNENDQNLLISITLIVIGLFQINISSAILLNVAENGFRAVSLNFIQSLITLLSNTFGYYYNVSGFLNIAIGIVGLSGFKAPIQMKNPFKETSVISFFEYWFIGLTSIFFKIINSFSHLKKEIHFNKFWRLLIFLTIFSLWHHPKNLIAILSFSIIISVFQLKVFPLKKSIPKWIKWIFTFGCINIYFLLLNTPDMQSASSVLKGLTSIETVFLYYNEFWILWPIEANFLTVLIIIGTFLSFKYPFISKVQATKKWKWILIAILIISIAFHNADIQPIYNAY